MSVDESQSVTITIKAIVQLSPIVLFTVLYTVVLTSEFVVKTVMYLIQMKVIEQGGWLENSARIVTPRQVIGVGSQYKVIKGKTYLYLI